MTKCLFKALKAVNLEQYLNVFRSLGYESAGALAHFRAEHFTQLNLTEQELLRLISLLDVLKDATRDGKSCPHYFTSSSPIKSSPPIRASWNDEKSNSKSKRSISSMSFNQRSTTLYDSLPQRSSTVLSRQHPITPSKMINQRIIGPKPFLNRPAVQHVKVKSYNYGVPTTANNRRNRTSFHRNVSSPRHSHDIISYAKPAEIYVYARKRPLLSTEMNFQDAITVPDNKRILITENKSNLDCTPLLKKTEFQFDQVFGSNISNREVFDSTVLPFLSDTHRHNLTYICFGQTGSGKSHTIFGSKSNDGLLVLCTELLLKEILHSENSLICSFYEIYNNQVYDLVNAGKRLFVREDSEHHVNVIGMKEFVLSSVEDLHCIIDEGLNRRHHGKSAFNSNSSRSHAIFQICLKNTYDATETFRLIFIDLAGSERATDAQNNQRQTRREGAQINWSLLALKECIRSMDLTHTHAPFRQSKLTHILRESLVGSTTRTCLMATVSPADDCCQCSLNTLQYASRIRDLSIRHRHRSMNTNIPTKINSFDEKQQTNFKPTTSSTPVHRLITTNSNPKKPLDINWQVVDDNVIDHSKKKKISNLEQPSPSSYFPQPLIDKKKSRKQSNTDSQLLNANGNERQWKSVPAPTINTTRMIPIVPMHLSDENPYNSATGTESLGTKITKAAVNDATSDSDLGKDPIEFFNNRDELLSIVSARLTPVSKRSSSVSTSKNSRVNSPRTTKVKASSSTTLNNKNRMIKSSSSTTSLNSFQHDKKPIEKKKFKVPSSQKFDRSNIRQTTTTSRPSQPIGPLRVTHDSLHRKTDVFTTPSKNTFSNGFQSPVFSSPSKDFGERVSDQLNALRSLLENRVNEPEEIKVEKKSILQTSPGTFARDFLQSLRQSTFNDDDYDVEVEKNFPMTNTQDKFKIYENDNTSTTTTSSINQFVYSVNVHRQPILSSFSDELNHARVSSSATPSSSSTIASNLVAKIDTQEQRNLSSPADDIHSQSTQNGLHQSANNSSTSTESYSLLPTLPSSNFIDHNYIVDNGKSNSLLAGTSFDALLNSLKSIREKDLDFVVRTTDDQLIPVAD